MKNKSIKRAYSRSGADYLSGFEFLIFVFILTFLIIICYVQANASVFSTGNTMDDMVLVYAQISETDLDISGDEYLEWLDALEDVNLEYDDDAGIEDTIILSFSFDSIEADTKVQTVFCSFLGEFYPAGGSDALVLKVNNELYRSRENEITSNYRQYNDFQVNGFMGSDNMFTFANVEFLTDYALGIFDEFSYGAGLGYEWNIFDVQIGIYVRSSVENEIASKIRAHLDLPIINDISFIFDNDLDINLNLIDDYRVSSFLCFRIPLDEYLNFETGFEINYKHKDSDVDVDQDVMNITKRYFAGGALVF